MKSPVISFNAEALSRFDEALSKEWLVTNGLGGYASGTILGVNTRKYHGLLVAALHPPGDRTVCVSKLDEDVYVGNDVYRLGTNEFANETFPQGYMFLKAFSVAPFPAFTYGSGGVEVTKTVFMPKNKNAISVIYKVSNQNSSEAKLRIYPMLTCRYFHTVVNRLKNPLLFTQTGGGKELETVFQHPQATILCRITEGDFHQKTNWVDRLFYRVEAARGEENMDDCFQPGYFELQVPAKNDKEFAISAAVSSERQMASEVLNSIGNSIEQINASLSQEQLQQRNLLYGFYGLHHDVSASDWLSWILYAADSFSVTNAAGKKAVIAGYHWFESWGRDTFVSLPGLLLVTGRFNGAKDILQTYNQLCQNGLIPNFVSDKSAKPAYNTVDGTLWYINAVLQYLKYTGDYEFVQEQLWDNLQAIINSHENGTMFGIHLDNDGLLMHGSRLTWMDAEVNGKEITPRTGKAVEIQALWYNTLRIMQLLANKFEDIGLSGKYDAMAQETSKSFNEKFWNPQLGCLYDVLDHKVPDASLRPNQIFAVSLDYTMLDNGRSRQVVDLVNRELTTPNGLRTLALSDPKFVGKCYGDRLSRDSAYHNGTIWPWLLGPFTTAYVKVNGYSIQSRSYAQNNLLLPLFSQGIQQAGLGTLSEIYDCDSPNTPRGCISQAWSIAEPLRAYIEDAMMVRPQFV